MENGQFLSIKMPDIFDTPDMDGSSARPTFKIAELNSCPVEELRKLASIYV